MAFQSNTYGSLNQSNDPEMRLPLNDPAVLIKPPLEAEAPTKRKRPSLRDLPPLFLPWLLYCMVLFPTALMKDYILSFLALTTGLCTAIVFVMYSRGVPWRILSAVCLVMVGLGYCMGVYDNSKYILPYNFYLRSPTYSDVLPQALPGSVGDAAAVSFVKGSHVDTTRSVGFVSGSLWCAAPIILHATDNTAGFWAVGKDCCRTQGYFACGDAQNHSVRGGVVVLDSSPVLQEELPQYRAAAMMAARTYGIFMPRNPMFIRWNEDVEEHAEWYADSALSFALSAAGCFLFSVPLLLAMLAVTRLSLFGEDAGPHWHPEKLTFMTFGIDIHPKVYPKYIYTDLFYGRTFWVGEPIQDYLFHVANKHVYLSCLFSHPAHPIMKWQRLIMSSTIVLCIFFSTAAFTSLLPAYPISRAIFVTVLLAVLGNFLKFALVRYAIEDSVNELERTFVVGHTNSRILSSVEYGICLGYLIATAVVVSAAAFVIHAAGGEIWRSLSLNVDVLGYIFVLDLLIDLASPWIGTSTFDGIWTVGFFGRWRYERDDFESSKQDLLEQESRPLWTSLGNELLGARSLDQRSIPAPARKMTKLQKAKVGQTFVLPSGVLHPTTEKAPLFHQFVVPAGTFANR
jgi:hypothetical protein